LACIAHPVDIPAELLSYQVRSGSNSNSKNIGI
jgi:hypothetical protein